jgi:hypothetical protein
MQILQKYQNERVKRAVAPFIFVGLLFIIAYCQFRQINDRDLYLVGTLVLHGGGGVKDCAIWKNGVKRTLDRDQINAVFNFGSSTFAFIDQGTNGVGSEFPIEFHLVNGTRVETMIDYEPTKHERVGPRKMTNYGFTGNRWLGNLGE